MWVVKLGGSLLGSTELPVWLAMLAETRSRRVVIVPGGGIFAEAVRQAQHLSGMPDVLAHQLAIIAMEQFGRLLASFSERFVLVESLVHLRRLQHQTGIWLPGRLLKHAHDLVPGWETTSDTIAAWLAVKIKAERLVLVKSVPGVGGVADWVDQGLVDRQLPHMLRRANLPCHVLHKSDTGQFQRAIDQLPGA